MSETAAPPADFDHLVASWLERDPDPATRAEIQRLLDGGEEGHAELRRRFAGRLEFGTAGLRGVLGAGPLRMNRLVVQETTAGLARYLLGSVEDAARRGVVIARDARIGSEQFARDAADVLAACGVRAHVFDRPVPTPVCAFAVTELGAAAGVMVTASHNPPEYNGYKVYWGNGAQIIPPHDAGIAAAIDEASQQAMPQPDAEARAAWIEAIGEALIERYDAGVRGLSIHPAKPSRATFTIAYTPLHGVGADFTERVLAQAGFQEVHTVHAQREPDGTFPTVRFPNPEEPGALDAVLELARAVGADLVLANDPDADRLAVAVPDPAAPAGYRPLSGNQIGVLLGADILDTVRDAATVATTIVSSRMLGRIAASHGAGYFETLTGFKWIANGAMRLTDPARPFAFGYEEAIGFTVGSLVRDKDGVSAAVAFAELAAELAHCGQTVLERLEALYREHGLFLTSQRSLALRADDPGPPINDRLRAAAPDHIAGRDVLAVTDLLRGERRERGGATSAVDLPPSDVLVYELEGDARVIVRPSGTEPKVKCYYEVCATIAPDEPFAAAEARAAAELAALADAHQSEL